MTPALEAWCDAFRPQDARTLVEWACENVKPPNSARASRFDIEQTPWLAEPINMAGDIRTRKQVLLMPTGAGKTTCLDVVIPYGIGEDAGGILLALQTDPDAKEYVEERLFPILKEVPSVAKILASMNRHSIRKDAIMFPHMPFYMGGANLTNAQRRSVRRVLMDEVWRAKHGLVKEFEARHHDRWNSHVMLMSQGGWTHVMSDTGMIETELEAAWQSTDQRVWHFACPECGDVQRFRWKALQYETVEKADGTLDEDGILQSAHYVCQGKCATAFEDTHSNRRALASAGRYVVTNQRHRDGHIGHHCNALTLHYLAWGQLAVELANAHFARKRGDDEPIRIFRQKRGAENYREEQPVNDAALTFGDYRLTDYCDGQLFDGEAARFLAIDVQRDHFWAVARAFFADGSSRLFYEGKISTWEGVEELSKRLQIRDFNTIVDCSYDADEVYRRCAAHSWVAFKGDKADLFDHKVQIGRDARIEKRFYSTVRAVRSSIGKPCAMVLWSNRQVKRILEKLRSGYRERFEVPKDVSDDYKASMFSEIEKDVIDKSTKRVERRFMRVGNRPNHKWDCESMIVAQANRKNLLAVTVEQEKTPARESAPAVN